jgi:hypothetical protein
MRARTNEALLRKYIAEILQESAMSELKSLFALSIKRVKEIVELAKGELQKTQADLITVKAEVLQHLLDQIRPKASEDMPEADDAADMLDVFLTSIEELVQKLKSKPLVFGRGKYGAELDTAKNALEKVAHDYFQKVKTYHATTLR